MNKNKVLYCITGLNKGGAEKTLAMLCINAKQIKGSFEPVVVSIIGGFYLEMLQKAGIKCVVLLGESTVFSALKEIFAIRKERRSIKIIHSFMPYGCLLGILFKLITGKKLIYSIRNSVLGGGGGKSNFFRDGTRYVTHWLSIKMSDHINVNSPYVVSLVKKEYNRDATVMLNCIEEPSAEQLEDLDIYNEFFSEKGVVHAVCVCNMKYPQKDIPNLLKVAAVNQEKTKFTIVGDGHDLKMFRELSLDSGLKNVVFVGKRENVYPFLNYADVFVCLSRHEGFPNTILEAMVAGVPVVFSDIPELRGLLENEKHLLLFKNEDTNAIHEAIVRLKSDQELKNMLVNNALHLVKEQFTVEKMVKRSLEIYNAGLD